MTINHSVKIVPTRIHTFVVVSPYIVRDNSNLLYGWLRAHGQSESFPYVPVKIGFISEETNGKFTGKGSEQVESLGDLVLGASEPSGVSGGVMGTRTRTTRRRTLRTGPGGLRVSRDVRSGLRVKTDNK